jgi:hypothetical protein
MALVPLEVPVLEEPVELEFELELLLELELELEPLPESLWKW